MMYRNFLPGQRTQPNARIHTGEGERQDKTARIILRYTQSRFDTEIPMTRMAERDTESLSKIEQEFARFAVAYADPQSSTFDDRASSLLAVRPALTNRKTARDTASRWLKDERCQSAIERVKLGVRIQGGLTAATYIELCLKKAQFYQDRGQKGDAIADARLIELAGKAAGLFVNVTKDITPPDQRKPPLSASDVIREVLEQSDRLRRLMEPIPTAGSFREVATASSTREMLALPYQAQ